MKVFTSANHLAGWVLQAAVSGDTYCILISEASQPSEAAAVCGWWLVLSTVRWLIPVMTM